MSRSLSAVLLFACLIASTTASAQGQSVNSARSLAIEINILEMTAKELNDIAKMHASRDQIDRLISEGKARLFAGLQLRTRTGENFSARVGERIPIQMAALPALRTADRNARDPRDPPQLQAAVPQISYENVGVNVEGAATAAGDGLLDIRIKIEMTGLDQSTGRLTPTFTQRTFADQVRIREGETAMLLGFVQPTSRQLSLEQIASGVASSGGAGFVVLLTAKPVQ